ncbi:MAG: GNAT family N-acetyltransferase [Halobacteriales archaeon]
MSVLRPAISKLTRSKPARRVYDGLVAAGIRLAVLDEFVRNLSEHPPTRNVDSRAITIQESQPTAVVPTDGDAPGVETLLLEAITDGRTVGRVRLVWATTVHVPELDRSVELHGGYIHDLHVDPTWRRRGVGSALVDAALRQLHERDMDFASALVAPDNAPSRRLFRSFGFAPVERHLTVAVGNRRYDSSRSYAGE